MFVTARILMVGAASVLALSSCNRTETPQPAHNANSAVAAMVNGTAISEQRVSLMAAQYAAQGQSADNPELRQGIIDQLAMQLLVSQEAVKKGLEKSPEVVEEIEVTRQAILARAFVQDYLKNGTVSEEVLAAEYERIKTEMAGNEFKARHILVEKEAEAKAIIVKLKANPNGFGNLARQSSRDRGSSDNGGDLGWFDPRGMVPEFAAALAKLEKGKFTEEPVKTQYGYHVILMEDSRPKALPPLDLVKPSLKQQLLQRNLKNLLEETKAKAKIEIVKAPSPAPLPAPENKPADAGK
jgi:peptidyl-prolyl cis-trans isomerase C